jgi:hypothetical protein
VGNRQGGLQSGDLKVHSEQIAAERRGNAEGCNLRCLSPLPCTPVCTLPHRRAAKPKRKGHQKLTPKHAHRNPVGRPHRQPPPKQIRALPQSELRTQKGASFLCVTRFCSQLTLSGDYTTLRRLFALQPLRSKTLLRPDSSDPIRQRGVQGQLLAITYKLRHRRSLVAKPQAANLGR